MNCWEHVSYKQVDATERLETCAAYILGVAEQLAMDGVFCLEGKTHSVQTVAVVKKYLSDHQEQCNYLPSNLVKRALVPQFA